MKGFKYSNTGKNNIKDDFNENYKKALNYQKSGNLNQASEIYGELINLNSDSSFNLNSKYFNYETGLSMISKNFEELFGKKTRLSSEKIEDFHANIASSIQEVTEDIYFKMINHLNSICMTKNLCLAGGVALNCVANGKIKKHTKFENIWIQPASGDAGGSIGAALSYFYKYSGHKRITNHRDSMRGSYLGTSYDKDQIKQALEKEGAVFEFIENDDELTAFLILFLYIFSLLFVV